jgi:hypothetical protein
MLLEEDPWNKLQVQAVLSAVCLTASTVICWLCETDPAGEQQQQQGHFSRQHALISMWIDRPVAGALCEAGVKGY